MLPKKARGTYRKHVTQPFTQPAAPDSKLQPMNTLEGAAFPEMIGDGRKFWNRLPDGPVHDDTVTARYSPPGCLKAMGYKLPCQH